jgi:hypothetical protein
VEVGGEVAYISIPSFGRSRAPFRLRRRLPQPKNEMTSVAKWNAYGYRTSGHDWPVFGTGAKTHILHKLAWRGSTWFH